MIIHSTQKLLKELRIQPAEPEAGEEPFSWHANLLRIERRKCVLFTHDTTLFSVLVPGLKRADFDRMDTVFSEELLRVMIWLGYRYPVECMGELLGEVIAAD